jgi:hypothetical protein
MPTISKTWKVETKGTGKPDYHSEVNDVARAVVTTGIKPKTEEGEEIRTLAIISVVNPGPLAFTRGGIAPAETVKLLDISNGFDYMAIPKGYDCLAKDLWLSFNQNVQLELYSYFHDDIVCGAYSPQYHLTSVLCPFGYCKTSMVPLDQEWKFEARLTNLGAATMYGKARLVTLMKEGSYTWR